MVNVLFAQNPVTLKLTEKEGLPDVEFYDITEDSEGFIWLAADKGLFRFDGTSYQPFTNPEKRGLSVFNLKIDRQNRIWCNNISGQFFYVKGNRLELFLDLKEELKGELVDFIFNNDKLLLFGAATLLEIDLKTKQRNNLWKKIKLPIKTIRAPYQMNGKIYFALNNDVYCITGSKIEKITSQPFISDNTTNVLKLFGYKNELYLYEYQVNLNKNRFFSIKDRQIHEITFPKYLEGNKVITITEDNGLLWFCTQKGVLSLKRHNTVFEINDAFFENDFITKKIIDKNKNIWLTTINNGVFIIPDLQVRTFENVISNNAIAVIEKISEDKIAIGTLKGDVLIMDLKNGNCYPIPLHPKNKIASLTYLQQQHTLLISTDNFSYCYDVNNGTLKQVNTFFNAKDICQIGKTDQLLFCGFGRANILEFKNNDITVSALLSEKRAYRSFYDETNKKAYITYVDNVVQYDQKWNSTILNYKGRSVIAKEICKTSNDVVWFGTYNEGALGFKNGKFIKNIDVPNGLSSNVVQQIKSDGDDLWIVTDKGVQVFNTLTNQFKPSLFNNTLIGNSKDLIVNKNQVLFATQEDIVLIDKNKKQHTPLPNKIYIQSVTINEKDTLVQQKYSLPYYKNRIKFTFHINGYYPKGDLQYEYRLSGLTNNWILLDDNVNLVNFNSLPSGEYIFQLRAKNRAGNHYVTTEIAVQINRPYWKKWWFIALLISIAFGIIIVFYRNKLAIKEKEKELALEKVTFESELAMLKLENLKSQMNPHFIFNALNSIQEYIVLNQKHLASSYLAKFADLIRAYLDHSSKGTIPLKEEIDCLNIYLELEQLRFEEKFSYKINYDENSAVSDIKIPTMLIQPYVENALKHGLFHKKENRQLSITFEKMENKAILKCTIQDNGVGRKKASELRAYKHKSFATEANQDRLNLLNHDRKEKIGVTIEDLLDSNNEPIGTKVTVLIPILNL